MSYERRGIVSYPDNKYCTKCAEYEGEIYDEIRTFYEKYGFIRVGNMFMEANIEHYKMVYEEKQKD